MHAQLFHQFPLARDRTRITDQQDTQLVNICLRLV
jgi:hypothetical protein